MPALQPMLVCGLDFRGFRGFQVRFEEDFNQTTVILFKETKVRKGTRQRALIAGLTLATLAVVSAASSAQPSAADGSVAKTKIVKIGVAGPLTGGLAHFGKDNENGALLAIEEINKTGLTIGGQRVTLVMDSQDDAGDPKTGTQVAQKLVDDGVVAVVGHYNSGVSIPASRIYSDADIAQISPSSTIPDYTLQGYKTTFRLVATDAAQSPALASYALKHLGIRRVAIVDDATQAGRGQANGFEKAALAGGATIVAHEATTSTATDFRAILTKIKSLKPDSIYYGGTDAGGGPFAKQAAGLGLNVRILGSDGLCTVQMAELAGDAVNKVACSEAGMPLSRMSQGTAFNAKYQARFGEPLVLYAPFTYDAVYVIVDAMKRSNSTDHVKILDAIHNTDYVGITGHIMFDAKGDIKEPAISIFDFEHNQKTLLDVVKLMSLYTTRRRLRDGEKARLLSRTWRGACKLSAFRVYSPLLSGRLGHRIDALDTNGIRATGPWRRAPEQASEAFDGKNGSRPDGQRAAGMPRLGRNNSGVPLLR